MKGILIEPGKGPVVTTLPDTLQGIEAWLGGHADQKYFSRTPAILMHSAAGREPNRIWRGEVLCGTLLCYGWRGGGYDGLHHQLQAFQRDGLCLLPWPVLALGRQHLERKPHHDA